MVRQVDADAGDEIMSKKVFVRNNIKMAVGEGKIAIPSYIRSILRQKVERALPRVK